MSQVVETDIRRILFPKEFRERDEILEKNKRFAYYTSADTALKVLENREVWMRNAACMNDYEEVYHGLECLKNAYASPAGDLLRKEFEALQSGFSSIIADDVNPWESTLKYHTYITSVSEHLQSEDSFGRLSMWRAYGRGSGVALIFRGAPFVAETDALGAYSFPARYENKQGMEIRLKEVAERLAEQRLIVSKQDPAVVRSIFRMLFVSWAVCTKHPAFEEEREWRIVHSPALSDAGNLVRDRATINGVPQIIYKIPLKRISDEENFDLSISGLLDRVLIGPTEFSGTMYDAFVDILKERGVPDAESRVIVTGVPLRQ